MKIIIVYASNSGNTKFTAEHIASVLRARQHLAVVQDVVETKPADLKKFDLIIFGSCTWSRDTDKGLLQAQLPEQAYQFAESLRGMKLPGKQFAVFGLGRHEYTGFCAAANHLQILVHNLGGKPMVPSLKIDGFPQQQVPTIEAWAKGLAKMIDKPVTA